MSLDLYLGPMFAGKSTAALAILRRNKVIDRKTLCLTSALDKRYADARLISHNMESFPAMAVNSLESVLAYTEYTTAECILIEEAQFFSDLKAFVLKAVEEDGKHVICVGLDGDSERRPFGQLNDLLPLCDSVTKFKALCTKCRDGTEAIFTYRKPTTVSATEALVNVGGAGEYEPLCRKHFIHRVQL